MIHLGLHTDNWAERLGFRGAVGGRGFPGMQRHRRKHAQERGVDAWSRKGAEKDGSALEL